MSMIITRISIGATMNLLVQIFLIAFLLNEDQQE